MATIEKVQRETGVVYKAKIRKQGHPTVCRTFKTRKAAERWAHKTEAEIIDGAAGVTTEAQRHTVRETIADYEREILPTLRPTTARPYRIHLAFWLDRLGHLRLSDLTPARIAECRDELKDQGKASGTINRYLATLASVLTFAVKERHWLAVSPMRAVSKPAEAGGRTRFLTQDELHRLLTACRESASPDLYLAVLLSITTGARRGEILGLRWRDLDLEKGIVSLRVDNETTTKGGIRRLPVAPQALAILKDRLRAEKVVDLTGAALVFPSRITRTHPVELRKPFETALRRAGIEGFRWHDLRHSAASFMAAHGASLLEIGAVLGHKSAQTTKRYAHLTEQATHALVRDLSDKLLGQEGGE